MATSVYTPGAAVPAGAAESTRSIPLHLAAVVLGATSILVGLIWDISWHMTIGRDTFWTPAHVAIYFGGTLAGLSCGARVLVNSFWRKGAHATDGVRLWKFFTGPIGGWICIWGALAMLTSAPFDDWWHNAYGLDVQILSPPHVVLLTGLLGILIGAQTMAVSAQNVEGYTTSRATVVAFASGVLLTLAAIAVTEYSDVQMMHHSLFYIVAGAVYPMLLVAASRASRLRWPATATAAFYMSIMAAQLWIFPLFGATPKLGPIGHEVTHMVPMNFPLLLIAPALAIDLVLRRMAHRNAWLTALVLGVSFVLAFLAMQWPFGSLLATEIGRHPFFGGSFAPYSVPAEWLVGAREFWVDQGGESVALMKTLTWGVLAAVVSARIGLAWGGWLREVKR
jgi:xanthosine utilization system XapX-like protein